MKVLMITPYLPYPPSSGGQIRSYNLIKQLSKYHEVTLYSLIKDQSEEKYVKNLEKYCIKVNVFRRPQKPWTPKNIINTGLSFFPFLVIRNYSQKERAELQKDLNTNNYDIIHAETFYVSPHIPKTSVPVVLVDQTIEYQVYQHYVKNFRYPPFRPILSIDVLKIKYWETYYWKKAAQVVAVSENDASKMRKLVPHLNVSVVPNGVGEDLMEDVNIHFSKTILFMGNYAWLQNIEAAKVLATEVFPLVLKKIPDATLTIAGQNTDKVNMLMSDHVKLVDLGIEDIEGVKKAYHSHGVLVAPLYGPGGTRLKILGAMAAKLPVVTTDIGIEGIDAINGESVLFGKRAIDLADLTIKILEDKSLYNKIAHNARKLVEEKYSYEAIAKKLDNIYHQAQNFRK